MTSPRRASNATARKKRSLRPPRFRSSRPPTRRFCKWAESRRCELGSRRREAIRLGAKQERPGDPCLYKFPARTSTSENPCAGHVLDKVEAIIARYFDGQVSGHVVISREGSGYRADCSLHLSSGVNLQAEGAAQEPHASFEQALDKIERRLRRYKTRLKGRQAAAPERRRGARSIASRQLHDRGARRERRRSRPTSTRSSSPKVRSR